MLNDAFFFVVVVAAGPDVLRAELLSPLLAGGPDLTPEEESAEDDEVSWDFLGSVEERGRPLVELWFLEEEAVAFDEEEEEDEEPFCKEPVGLRGAVTGEVGGLVREAGIVVVFSSALSLMVMRFVDGFPERERGLEVALFADEREGEDGGREAEVDAEKEGGFVEGPSNGLCDNTGEGEDDEDEAEEAAEAAARRWEISLV